MATFRQIVANTDAEQALINQHVKWEELSTSTDLFRPWMTVYVLSANALLSEDLIMKQAVAFLATLWRTVDKTAEKRSWEIWGGWFTEPHRDGSLWNVVVSADVLLSQTKKQIWLNNCREFVAQQAVANRFGAIILGDFRFTFGADAMWPNFNRFEDLRSYVFNPRTKHVQGNRIYKGEHNWPLARAYLHFYKLREEVVTSLTESYRVQRERNPAILLTDVCRILDLELPWANVDQLVNRLMHNTNSRFNVINLGEPDVFDSFICHEVLRSCQKLYVEETDTSTRRMDKNELGAAVVCFNGLGWYLNRYIVVSSNPLLPGYFWKTMTTEMIPDIDERMPDRRSTHTVYRSFLSIKHITGFPIMDAAGFHLMLKCPAKQDQGSYKTYPQNLDVWYKNSWRHVNAPTATDMVSCRPDRLHNTRGYLNIYRSPTTHGFDPSLCHEMFLNDAEETMDGWHINHLGARKIQEHWLKVIVNARHNDPQNRHGLENYCNLWLAHFFVHYGVKPDSVLVCQGKQGCGKSTFFQHLGRCMCPSGFMICENVQTLTDQFRNPNLLSANLVVFEEPHFDLKSWLAFKEQITSDYIEVQKKYQGWFQSLAMAYRVICTNFPRWFANEPEDSFRRFIMLHCDGRYAGNNDYFDELLLAFVEKRNEGLKIFLGWLVQYWQENSSGWKIQHVPSSTLKEYAMRENRGAVSQWFRYALTSRKTFGHPDDHVPQQQRRNLPPDWERRVREASDPEHPAFFRMITVGGIELQINQWVDNKKQEARAHGRQLSSATENLFQFNHMDIIEYLRGVLGIALDEKEVVKPTFKWQFLSIPGYEEVLARFCARDPGAEQSNLANLNLDIFEGYDRELEEAIEEELKHRGRASGLGHKRSASDKFLDDSQSFVSMARSQSPKGKQPEIGSQGTPDSPHVID